jgi:NAD(P)H-hydrate repair Nnr-like enzyme with NAD(P)H-hydrate dehydratase domain
MAAFIHGVAGQLLSKGEISPLRSRELADALPDAVAAIRGSRT